MARSSCRSPGRETTLLAARVRREATFLANSAAGCATALLNWLRAAARPRSEPATVNHTVTPFAGTLSVYRSWPPAPLPYAVSSQTGGVGGVFGPLGGQITGGARGPPNAVPVLLPVTFSGDPAAAPTTAAQSCADWLGPGGVPRSRKTRRPPEAVAVSGRLTAVWLGFVSPQG